MSNDTAAGDLMCMLIFGISACKVLQDFVQRLKTRDVSHISDDAWYQHRTYFGPPLCKPATPQGIADGRNLVSSSLLCAGPISANQVTERLKTPSDQAQLEAHRLNTRVLFPGVVSVSAGDILADNGQYICHRATSHDGMFGSAAGMLCNPNIFMGIHMGTSGVLLPMPPCLFVMKLSMVGRMSRATGR